jgi:hypothetical protein
MDLLSKLSGRNSMLKCVRSRTKDTLVTVSIETLLQHYLPDVYRVLVIWDATGGFIKSSRRRYRRWRFARIHGDNFRDRLCQWTKGINCKCGGAHNRTRPSSVRRPRKPRNPATASNKTGRQTAKRLKAGARVTSKNAFVGEGMVLAEGEGRGSGAGFGKQAAR